MENGTFKQKFVHEMREMLLVVLFIAPFVFSLVTYRMYLGLSEKGLIIFGTALVTSLMLSKIVLIQELTRMGTRSESRPLLVSALYKSAFFVVLYLAFHGLESTFHGLRHGQSFLAGMRNAFVTERSELLLLGLVAFFAAFPFFALRETRRIMGPDAFRRAFFGRMLPQDWAKSPGVARSSETHSNSESSSHSDEVPHGLKT